MNPSESPPNQRASAPTWRAVRRDRRTFYTRILLPILVLWAIWEVTSDMQAGNGFSPSAHLATLGAALCGAISGFMLVSAIAHVPCFKYDPRSGRIEARDTWGRRRVYPEPGFELLEFSPTFAEVHEVAADGRRRRLAIGSTWAVRADWQEFVESFHPAAHLPIPIRPPQDQS